MNKGLWSYIPNIQLFKYRGYYCKILKQDMGHLCGYVNLPKKFNKDIKLYDVDCVHGGITYELNGVIGFDCAHYMDYVPALDLGSESNYKDDEFVRNELKKLVNQLISMNN